MNNIFNFENLYSAYLFTRKGKRDKDCVARYGYKAIENTIRLEHLLNSKRYKPSPYIEFYVYEPKKRLIKAPPFHDRVVQRCLCEHVLEPAIEKHLIYDTYACRENKGTHAGIERTTHFMKRHYRKHGRGGWIIKGDIKSFFYSISHGILKRNLYPLLKDYDVWWLISLILNDEVGLPLGNQSSQWLANFYLSGFDHYVKEIVGVKHYIRYMDDFVAIVETKEQAQNILEMMRAYLKGELRLETNSKTQIMPLKNGVDFLGFHLYITSTGKVIKKIRRDSKERMKRKLKSFKSLHELGLIEKDEIDKSYESWKGHARHGSCYHLIQEMDKIYDNIFEGDG